MSNKKENTLIKDALILFIITLIAGLSLGFVNEITKEPIKAIEMSKKLEAYQMVLKDAEHIKEDEKLNEKLENFELSELNNNFAGIKINEVNQAFDKDDNMIGYIVIVTTNNGYGGAINLAVGYKLDGAMTGMEILSMKETADLGTKANEDEFKSQFINKNVKEFVVTKVGANSDEEINAISGATITSSAVVQAINGAIAFVNEFGEIVGGKE